ncbi:MAG: helix-turn-helix transcriptional regulator [Acidobacteriota bacterium]
MKDTNWSEIHTGDLMRSMLEARGLTVTKLAAATDMTRSGVSTALSQPSLNWKTIARLCVAMDATPTDFAVALVAAAGEPELVPPSAASAKVKAEVTKDLAGSLMGVVGAFEASALQQSEAVDKLATVLRHHASGP